MTLQRDENLTPKEAVHKHTTSPTPWEACGGVVRDAESIGVCACDWLVKDRAGSNAALIVRAVNCHEELLAALDVAVDWIVGEVCRRRCNKPGCDAPGELCAGYLGHLKAAIRKARGEQE